MPPTATTFSLDEFLARIDENARASTRSVANAWLSGGGSLQVGGSATRLIAQDNDTNYTAATIYAKDSRLEICRVILGHHGLGADKWTHWSDEFIDLAHHGFDATAKYPSLPLAAISATELARLVTGIRDLANLA